MTSIRRLESNRKAVTKYRSDPVKADAERQRDRERKKKKRQQDNPSYYEWKEWKVRQERQKQEQLSQRIELEDPEKDDTIIESNNIYLKTLQKDRERKRKQRQREELFGVHCTFCDMTFSSKCLSRNYWEVDYKSAGLHRGRTGYCLSHSSTRTKAEREQQHTRIVKMIQEGKWGKITCPQCSNEAAILNEPTKVFQYTRRAVRFEVMVRDQANSHFKHEAMRLGRCDDRSYNFDASRTDRDIVLAAVQKQGIALKYASEALKADREIVLAAVKNNGYALQYASEDHKADREIVQAAIKIDPCALLCASEALSADREIVLSAVQRGGSALEYASEALRADREIVLAAVKQDRSALKYASEALKADSEFESAGGAAARRRRRRRRLV